MDQEVFNDKNQQQFEVSVEPSKTQENDRQKTALRMKYEAESQVIRKKLGSLEEIRSQLGLTQRKMCQLLMVDPSAWSRWQKDQGKIPPHIYRSLQWYMALIDKAPEWHPLNSYLGAFRSPKPANSQKTENLQEELDDIQRQLKTTLHHNHLFMEEVRKHTQIHWGWKMIMILNLVVLAFTILF